MHERGSPLYLTAGVPVDAHVHFHRRRFVDYTLEAAAANFERVTKPSGRFAGMLLLAESAGEMVFAQLPGLSSRWTIRPIPTEPQTVIASLGGREIAVVCGRQIRCRDGLEVLALGTTTRYPEGDGVRETIERVRRDGSIAVFPWGFGKWIGRARRTVDGLFGESSAKTFFAGDNGGRLGILGLPRQLREASRNGFRVLPGTDPFPFGKDYRRVGTFGFLADITPQPGNPWQSLLEWLDDERVVPRPYGHALSPIRFIFNQSGIQVRNRILNRRTA